MIEATSVIKKVLISEKSAVAAEKLNQYTIHVERDANKVAIAQAVESAFKGTKVAWVHTINTPRKRKRILTRKGGYGVKMGIKKAIVCLKEGKIEIN